MNQRRHPTRHLIQRRPAWVMLLVLIFTLGKGIPLPAMAAGAGHTMPTAAAAPHCLPAGSHTNPALDASTTQPAAPTPPAHDSCCPDEAGSCVLHCAVPLPVSIPHIALPSAVNPPEPMSVSTLAQRSLPPPQRPPKV